MSINRRDRSNFLPAVAAATVLIGVSLLEPLATGTTTAGPGPGQMGNPNTSPFVEPDIALAEAVAGCDLSGAEAALEQVRKELPAASRSEDFPSDRLVLGLAAERCQQYSKSLELLRAQPAEGRYGDWHLLALARSAIELGQYPAASAALERFRADHSSSPLFESAILTASRLAELRGDLATVAEITRQSRHWQIGAETSDMLEVAAWNAGIELDDPGIRRAAAIELLSQHPLRASELGVIEEFRARDGSLDWLEFLSPERMVRRAESLMSTGLLDSALATLSEVDERARDASWHLVSAQALTASGRGEEALSLLDEMKPGTRAQASEREWQRALAALEVSSPKAGRQLNAVQRQMMRDRAHRHLETAIARDLDPERTRRAFRILFEDALEDDRFELALETLQRLKKLDPEDTTGARQLWRLGWKEHNDHNYSGAIGYWTELSSLYPRSSYNRSGLYWTALAHQSLGNTARSRQLLEEVAEVPFTDFYRRHAQRRLGSAIPEPDTSQTPTEPWPRDPALARAELLFSLGLNEASLVEIEALSPHVDRRSRRALKAQVLAASGERRESIIEIKSVFPLLGTPFQGMVPEHARFLYYPVAFDDIVFRHAAENNLDRNLVLAMIRQESAFDPRALSWAGARGLMQVMPATGREIARRLGLRYTKEHSNDPAFSIQLGTAYYKQVRSMFDDDDELSLAGYNAGPYRIKRLWRQAGINAELDHFLETLNLAETRSYVKRVLLFSDSYERLYSGAG